MANPLQLPFIFASATSPVSSVNLDNDFNYLAGTLLDTITALRLTTPKTTGPPRVILFGSSAVGTGQTGFFWYNAADTTSADNGSTIIVAADGARWYYAAIQAASIQGSHTLPDSVLSTNVPLLNLATNVFLAAGVPVRLANSSAAEVLRLGGPSTTNSPSFTFYSNGGSLSCTVSENDSTDTLTFTHNRSPGSFLFTGGGAGTWSWNSGKLSLDSAGLVTTPHANSAEVGYQGLPENQQTGSYTLVLADANSMIYKGSGATGTWTIPAGGSVAYPVGTTLTFSNRSGNPQNIAINTDTLVWAGVGTTGTRSLASNGIATAVKINSTEWLISGPGLS